ncbi:MAG: YkgJ family cysteine cluster protein [Treponemataceae bacterium]
MTPFYAGGLHFSCARCSDCCRHDPGFVFLSGNDSEHLAKRLGLEYSSFIVVYCRWVPAGGGTEMLSLKERSNYDCILWGTNGCSVYEDRPLQCKTFPFWNSVIGCEESWRATAVECLGMDTGRMYDREEIDRLLALRENDPVVVRNVIR